MPFRIVMKMRQDSIRLRWMDEYDHMMIPNLRHTLEIALSMAAEPSVGVVTGYLYTDKFSNVLCECRYQY